MSTVSTQRVWDVVSTVPVELQHTATHVVNFCSDFVKKDQSGNGKLFDWPAFKEAIDNLPSVDFVVTSLDTHSLPAGRIKDLPLAVGNALRKINIPIPVEKLSGTLDTIRRLDLAKRDGWADLRPVNSKRIGWFGRESSWEYRLLIQAPNPELPDELLALVATLRFHAPIKAGSDWRRLGDGGQVTATSLTLMTVAVSGGFSSPRAANWHALAPNNATDYGRLGDSEMINDKATIGFATLHGGTSGGGSVDPVVVDTLATLKEAVVGNSDKVILISGTIAGLETIKLGSNTSIIGKSGAALTGVGINTNSASNIIIRNLKISKAPAAQGAAIAIVSSNHVWIDHVELFSTEKDSRSEALIDISSGSYDISVTYSHLHDNYFASVVGTDKVNDAGLTVTYAFNKWANIIRRCPSFRSGKGHLYNNYFVGVERGIFAWPEGNLLVQNNVFEEAGEVMATSERGGMNESGNHVGNREYTIQRTSWCHVGYSYTLTETNSTKPYVNSNVGAILSF
ncbi:hypothetical protein FRC06_000182 [Ceratobasidium sp. 370]|nr:hypothetical protein FRC06_000182 [Ceratobasidium sp. 370]